MAHFSDLPGYKKLTKTEKKRFGDLYIAKADFGNYLDKKIKNSVKTVKSAKKSNITLYPADLDFIDYRGKMWGDAYSWASIRPLSAVKYLVIHHSVTPPTATPEDVALIHKARGWKGIGYHFLITGDGKIWYVGDIGTARANVENLNTSVIGICLVGNFVQMLPTDPQIISAHRLSHYFLNDFPALSGLSGWESVVGHKDLGATACPGTSWGAGSADSMESHIRTGTPYGASR